MKHLLIPTVLILFNSIIYGQGVGINADGSSPAPGAILDIKSTSSGLLIPRMTEAQRDAITPNTQSMLIYQTNNDSGFYYYDGGSWIPFLTNTNGANGGWNTKGNTGTTVGTHFLGTTDAEDFAIYTNNNEVIRVRQNGNVGIGTSTPSSLLNLSGSNGNDDINLIIDNTTSPISATTYSKIRIEESGTTAFDIGYNHNTQKLKFENRGLTNTSADGDSHMTIDSNGNVGIGTNSPSGIFQVQSDLDATKDSSFIMTTDGKLGIGNVNPSARLHIDHNATGTAMYVTGGNVGNALAVFERDIGSSSIYTIRASGSDLYTEYDVSPGSGTIWRAGVDDSSDNFSIWTGGGLPGAADEFSILTNGRVGIGTTSPASKLHISDAGSNEFKITAGTNTMTLRMGVGGAASLLMSANGSFNIGSSPGGGTVILNGAVFRPQTDNFCRLGGASQRWTEVFAVNGTINTSDKRLKKQIRALNYGLATVMKMKPVSYRWKENDNGVRLGFIAQDVLDIVPEVVHKEEDQSKFYGLRYTELVPILTKAIQDQQAIIDRVSAENKKLKAENELTNTRLKRVEELIGIKADK